MTSSSSPFLFGSFRAAVVFGYGFVCLESCVALMAAETFRCFVCGGTPFRVSGVALMYGL